MNQQQANIDLSNSEAYVCEECGDDTFVTVFKLRKLSSIASPTGAEMLVPIQALACRACGYINKEFLPDLGEDSEDESPLTLV